MKTIYHLPVLSALDLGVFRSPGPGLGNLLFPISRAVIAAHVNNDVFVPPTIRQIKLGPILRNERDKRIYGNVFKHRSPKNWMNRFASIFSPKRIEGTEINQTRSYTVLYKGLGNYFHDLKGHHTIITDWLKARAVLSGELSTPYDIGIHIRLGDFVDKDDGSGKHSVRTPYEWYRKAYGLACERLELPRETAKVMLFTDEDPVVVRDALGLKNINIDPSTNGITAIHNLSKARCVVTSRSTFSMWAVYLGNMPAIWDKKLNLSDSFPPRPNLDMYL